MTRDSRTKLLAADLHLVGKEIIRFHASIGRLSDGRRFRCPNRQAHGWLLFEEGKMSKSRGNIVRAETILEGFGALKPDLSKAEHYLFLGDALAATSCCAEIAFGPFR